MEYTVHFVTIDALIAHIKEMLAEGHTLVQLTGDKRHQPLTVTWCKSESIHAG